MNYLSVLILSSALQGFFLFFALYRLKRGNTSAHRIISLFALLIAITLVGRFVFTIDSSTPWLLKFLYIGDISIFFFGPLLFFYFQKLFQIPLEWKHPKWLHLIPLFIFCCGLIPIVLADAENFERTVTYMNPVFESLEVFAIALNFIYLAISNKLMHQFIQSRLQISSELPQLNFYKLLLGISVTCLGVWAFTVLMRYFGPVAWHNYWGYQLVWITLSCTVLALGYYVIRHPEAFDTIEIPDLPFSSVKLQFEVEMASIRITEIMNDSKPYLDSKLSLPGLSDLCGLPLHTTSKAINETFRQNFYDFINGYRINEFKRIATHENLKSHTIFALALESGFNSKTAFNTAFKRITGQTPSQYIKSIINEPDSYSG